MRFKFLYKVNGGALYYSILISFLVALFTGFLLSSILLHQSVVIKFCQKQRLDRNIRSALTLAKLNPEIHFGGKQVVDLYRDGEDEVSLNWTIWGGYLLINAQCSINNLCQNVVELCGINSYQESQLALFLCNNDKPLNLSGNSVIKGDCFIPNSDVRRSNIEGKPFSGDQLINGSVMGSPNDLPELNSAFVDHNSFYLNSEDFSSDSILSIDYLFKEDSIVNSFNNPTIIFFVPNWIRLTNKYISGNVKIISSKGITICKDLKVSDIIVYAPKIEIEDNFSGALQMFATDTIIIQENSQLMYPSLLAIISSKGNPYIGISKNAKVFGDIIMQSKYPNIENYCNIDDNSEVNGMLYCNGKIELKGNVNGSVLCKSFVLKTSGAIYENHLLDVSINPGQLSSYYAGSCFFNSKVNLKSIKWLF
jgi:hypothetical protein